MHAVTHDDGARDRGHLLQVVRGAGGHLTEHDVLRGAATEQHLHLVLQFLACHQEPVLGRPLYGVAQGTDAARDDGNLVYSIGPRQRQRHQRVAHFVVRHDPPLVRVEQAIFLLQAGDDALDGNREVIQRHRIAAPTCCGQRGLVAQVRQVGT